MSVKGWILQYDNYIYTYTHIYLAQLRIRKSQNDSNDRYSVPNWLFHWVIT